MHCPEDTMIDFHKAVADITPEITAMRNHIHENPELSMKEYKTCALLRDYIEKNVAYDSLKPIGETGLYFELRGTKHGAGKTLLFRGDIDALPIQEDPNMKPCSKIPGVMHACGHDVHGTINVGAASILSKHKDLFSGTVSFYIQPAEEILCGAKMLLEDADIDLDGVDDFAALHCSPEIPAGTIGTRYGPILASADEIKITVRGKGGHAAHCHTVRDPVVAASAIITALQTLVSRETNPANSVVVSICILKAGDATNIIPDFVELGGTFRTLDPEDRERTAQGIKRVAESVAEAYRTEAEVEIKSGVPPFVNTDEWVDKVFRAGEKMLGKGNTLMMPYAAMGGDDAAIIKGNRPGVFIRLGSRTPGGLYGSLHSSSFYSDPKSIPTGMLTIIGLVSEYFGFEA